MPHCLTRKCWFTGKMAFKSNSQIILNLMLLNQFYTCYTASQIKWRERDLILKLGNCEGLRSYSDFAKFCNRFSDFTFFCLDVQISDYIPSNIPQTRKLYWILTFSLKQFQYCSDYLLPNKCPAINALNLPRAIRQRRLC